MADPPQPLLCEIFTKSFVMSAQETSNTLPEKTITEHLIGFTAFATAFGAVTVVEILTPGLLKKNYAVMVGKAAKQGADYLVEATKKSKWKDDTLKIKEIIQRGDPTAKTLYCDLFQCYFTNLAIEIYFCFEEIIVIMCTKKKMNVITAFEEFGKFAGKLCYAGCKGANGPEETIQNFIDIGFFDKLEQKFKATFNFLSKFEQRAQKQFTQTIPAWCPNTQNSKDIVVVERSVWNKNKEYTLRPPFRFEQEHLSKLWNSAKKNKKTKQFSRPLDFQSFCYKEHQDIVNNLILEIQYDETINPEKAIMHCIRSCAKDIIAEVNKHTDETVKKNKKKLSNPEPRSALFIMEEPSRYFIGRKTELFEIHKALHAETDLQGSLPLVIITGLTGMGKTETARKYALTRYKDVYSVIIVINAETLSSLGRSLIKAMTIMTNNNLNPAGYEAMDNIISLAQDLYDQLSVEYKHQKILLIFDNAIQMENHTTVFGIRPFLPKPKHDTCFYILVTSQNQNWHRCYPAIILNELKPEDVYLLLKEKITPYLTNPDMEVDLRHEINNLMKHILMGYPLGIKVATSIILDRNDGIGQDRIPQSEMKTKIQDYVSKFNTSDKMIAHKSQTGYSNGIKDKLDLAIECIEKRDNGTRALELFHMMSYLSPGDIDIKDCYSVFYFEQQNLDDPSSKKTRKQTKELDKCMNLLKNMSLITRHGNQFIEVHQLVQKIIRQKFKANVGNLNMWFKPLPFVLDDPYKHALHVFTNICSTSSPENIPIYALLSMYSEFKYFHEHRSQPLLKHMNRKIKKLIKKARRNVAMELHGQNFDLLEFLNHVVCITDVGLQSSTDPHIPGMFHVMEKYMDDLILQYIGINVVITSERPLTQVEGKPVTKWTKNFLNQSYLEQPKYMSKVYDRALYRCLKHIQFSYESDTERTLRSLEMFVELSQNADHPIHSKPQFWSYFSTTLWSLFHDYKTNDHFIKENGNARMNNVVLKTVDIITNKLPLSFDNDAYFEFGDIYDVIVLIAKTAGYANMFWSSKPFMDAFVKCSCKIAKKEVSNKILNPAHVPLDLVRVAVVFIVLFAEASGEAVDPGVLIHNDMKKVLAVILGHIRRSTPDHSSDLPSFLSFYLPSSVVESFMKNHGDKDMWLATVARAGGNPSGFFANERLNLVGLTM